MKQIEKMSADEFRKHYNSQHKYCPNCGNEHCITTLAGYILNTDKMNEYCDRNRCDCDCGFVHTVHDRVATKSLKK